MNNFLLLGAGFSRNWVGWVASEVFEYLLGCPEIQADVRLRELLWSHQLKGGFEDALAELQGENTSYARDPWAESRLVAFQNAVGRTFDAMNNAFLDLKDMEFQRNDPDRMVRSFFTRFNAIFTLNQDVLLEQFYLVDNVVRSAVRPYVPGMRWTRHPEPIYSESLSRATWIPQDQAAFQLQRDSQPFFKLHGSSKLVHRWRKATSNHGWRKATGDRPQSDPKVVQRSVRRFAAPTECTTDGDRVWVSGPARQ